MIIDMIDIIFSVCASGDGECLNVNGRRPNTPDLAFNLPHTCTTVHTLLILVTAGL